MDGATTYGPLAALCCTLRLCLYVFYVFNFNIRLCLYLFSCRSLNFEIIVLGGSTLPGDFFEKPQAPKKGILKNAPARPTYAPKPAAATRLAPDVLQDEKMDTDDSGPTSQHPAGLYSVL